MMTLSLSLAHPTRCALRHSRRVVRLVSCLACRCREHRCCRCRRSCRLSLRLRVGSSTATQDSPRHHAEHITPSDVLFVGCNACIERSPASRRSCSGCSGSGGGIASGSLRRCGCQGGRKGRVVLVVLLALPAFEPVRGARKGAVLGRGARCSGALRCEIEARRSGCCSLLPRGRYHRRRGAHHRDGIKRTHAPVVIQLS